MKNISLILSLSILVLLLCKNKETAESSSSSKTESNKIMTTNPLMVTWDTPFGMPPFDKFKSENYLPALKEAIQIHKKEVDVVVNNTNAPTFKNTVEALEISGKLLSKISNVFFAVSSANTDDVLKEARKSISPELTVHFDEISLNTKLFNRIKAVYDFMDKLWPAAIKMAKTHHHYYHLEKLKTCFMNLVMLYMAYFLR